MAEDKASVPEPEPADEPEVVAHSADDELLPCGCHLAINAAE
jgi:hypothetical protein